MAEMSEPQKKADWPVIATAVTVLLLAALAIYVAGYFALPHTIHGPSTTLREYPAPWLASTYYYAGKVETYFAGWQIDVIDDQYFFGPDLDLPR